MDGWEEEAALLHLQRVQEHRTSAQCHSPSTLIPDFASSVSQGNIPALLPAQGRCQPLPRLDLVPGQKEGKGEGLASRGWHRPCESRVTAASPPCSATNKHGHSWQSLEQRGSSGRERAAVLGPYPQLRVRSINWQFSSAQIALGHHPDPLLKAPPCLNSTRLCFPPLCPHPEHRGEMNSSTRVSRREYIVI